MKKIFALLIVITFTACHSTKYTHSGNVNSRLDFKKGKWLLHTVEAPKSIKESLTNIASEKFTELLGNRFSDVNTTRGILLPANITTNLSKADLKDIKNGTGYDFFIKINATVISDEVGISVGNLQYHFKKREDIVETLYFQLVGKMDAIFIIPTDDLLKSFLNTSIEIFATLFEYHFFLLDFVAITRRNPKIKSHYSELSKRREIESLKVIDVLIKNGLFREELLKNEYRNLFKRTEVISNFWFSSVLIQAETLSKESINEYSVLIGQSIYPYLTNEAKNQYANIFPSQLV